MGAKRETRIDGLSAIPAGLWHIGLLPGKILLETAGSLYAAVAHDKRFPLFNP